MQTKLLNINELAEYLGIKISTVYSWVNQRKIPYIKVGRLVKFDRVDIDKWLAEQKVPESKLDYSG